MWQDESGPNVQVCLSSNSAMKGAVNACPALLSLSLSLSLYIHALMPASTLPSFWRKQCLSPPLQDPDMTKVTLRQTVGGTAVIREVRWGGDAVNSLRNTRVDDCEYEIILESIHYR